MVKTQILMMAAIFLAGAFGTIIGIGWRMNRNKLSKHDDKIESNGEQIRSLTAILFGDDDYPDIDSGEINGIQEHIEEIHEAVDRIEERSSSRHEELYHEFRELLVRLDEMETVEEFDRTALDSFEDDEVS